MIVTKVLKQFIYIIYLHIAILQSFILRKPFRNLPLAHAKLNTIDGKFNSLLNLSNRVGQNGFNHIEINQNLVSFQQPRINQHKLCRLKVDRGEVWLREFNRSASLKKGRPKFVNGTCLGIDYGSRSIGIALGYPKLDFGAIHDLCHSCQIIPLTTLYNTGAINLLINQILSLINKYKAKNIIIGSNSNTANNTFLMRLYPDSDKSTHLAEQLNKKLRELAIKPCPFIWLTNEAFSTQKAKIAIRAYVSRKNISKDKRFQQKQKNSSNSFFKIRSDPVAACFILNQFMIDPDYEFDKFN